jgi:hypothetical protein
MQRLEETSYDLSHGQTKWLVARTGAKKTDGKGNGAESRLAMTKGTIIVILWFKDPGGGGAGAG